MQQRIASLDIIRVLAILMVIITHATEVFYITSTGQLEIAPGDHFWVVFINSAAHACVALFVMVSGYLLLPIKQSQAEFYKTRIPKIFIPFVIWSLIYIFAPLAWNGTSGDAISYHLNTLLFNFSWASGHLWFIYMFLGVYLFMPIISPWLRESSKDAKQVFLALWLFSTLYHYLAIFAPDGMLLGQTFFSEFSALWYFSGFLGYAVLGHYVKAHVHWGMKKSVAVGSFLYAVGLLSTCWLFDWQLSTAQGLGDLALSLRSCTLNVALMTLGIFLMLKNVDIKTERPRKAVGDLSRFSFGIYLIHMLILPFVAMAIGSALSTPVTIVLVSVLTFLLTYMVAKLISYLPKSGYLIAT